MDSTEEDVVVVEVALIEVAVVVLTEWGRCSPEKATN